MKAYGWLYRQNCSLTEIMIFWWNPPSHSRSKHTLSFMDFTYSSTIWVKSSASYALVGFPSWWIWGSEFHQLDVARPLEWLLYILVPGSQDWSIRSTWGQEKRIDIRYILPLSHQGLFIFLACQEDVQNCPSSWYVYKFIMNLQIILTDLIMKNLWINLDKSNCTKQEGNKKIS